MGREQSTAGRRFPVAAYAAPTAITRFLAANSRLLDCKPRNRYRTAMSQTATAPANAEKHYAVHRDDLPLSCPLPSMALWNSHPRVYLAIEDAPGHEVQCPYCGAHFTLAD